MKKPGMLTDRQRKAILALAASPTKEAASRLAGVSRTALFEWLREKPFQDELQRVRAELYAEGLAVLKASTSKAAGVLLDLLGSKDANCRRLAAGQILQLGLKAAEMEMTEGRLVKLEQILEAGAFFAGGGLLNPRRKT